MRPVIHCDKCNSDNVLHEPVRQPVQEEHKTMSEIVESKNKPQWQNAVYFYTYYILLCKDCGHRVEYYI